MKYFTYVGLLKSLIQAVVEIRGSERAASAMHFRLVLKMIHTGSPEENFY